MLRIVMLCCLALCATAIAVSYNDSFARHDAVTAFMMTQDDAVFEIWMYYSREISKHGYESMPLILEQSQAMQQFCDASLAYLDPEETNTPYGDMIHDCKTLSLILHIMDTYREVHYIYTSTMLMMQQIASIDPLITNAEVLQDFYQHISYESRMINIDLKQSMVELLRQVNTTTGRKFISKKIANELEYFKERNDLLLSLDIKLGYMWMYDHSIASVIVNYRNDEIIQ